MNDATRELVQYVATLAALLTATLVLAIVHNAHGATMALGGLLGFATGARPGASIPRPAVTLGVMGLALALGVGLAGCGASAAPELGCDIARKVCMVANGVCSLAATSGSETP